MAGDYNLPMGYERNGYSYQGGDPNDKKNWEKIPTPEDLRTAELTESGVNPPDLSESMIGRFQQGVKKTGNVLLDTIMFLDKPRNMLASGAMSAVDDPSPANIWQGVKEGFAQDVETYSQDFYPLAEELVTGERTDQFRKNYPITSTLTGIAGDFGSDPLTYTPAALLSVPFRLAKGVGRLAKLDKGFASLVKGNQNFFAGFNLYVGNAKKAKELSDKYRHFIEGAEFKGLRSADELGAVIDDLARQSGVPREELMRGVIDNIETGTRKFKLGKFETELQGLERHLVERNKQMLQIEQDLNVRISDLGVTYFPHILTKEALQSGNFKKTLGDFLNKPNLTHASTKQRKLEDTIKNINRKNNKERGDLFTTDVTEAMFIRNLRHANVVQSAKYIQDAKSKFGVIIAGKGDDFANSLRAKGHRELKLSVPKDVSPEFLKKYQGTLFPDDVAQVIERQYKVMSNPKELENVLKVYDGVQNWWKKWTLGARPSYHARNFVGNVWNGYVGGLQNPMMYEKSGELMAKAFARTGKRSDVTWDELGNFKVSGLDDTKPFLKGTKYTEQQIYDAAVDHGVFGFKGQYGADIPLAQRSRLADTDPLWKKATLGVITPSAEKNIILKTGFKFGGAVENNARLALFMDGLSKGKNFDEAAKHVQKHLFDYKDLGRFEESTLKRLVPFYTWSRKNIPLALETLVNHPDKVQKINIIRNNIEADISRPPPKDVPDYIKDQGGIFTRQYAKEQFYDENGKLKEGVAADMYTIYSLTGYLPLMDVNRIISPESLITSMVSPIIKAPLEYFSNYDWFRQEDIIPEEVTKMSERMKSKGVQHSTDFLGVRMPKRTAHLLKNLVMLNELDRLNPFDIFGEATVTESGEYKRTPSYGLEETKSVDLPLGLGTYSVGHPREERTDIPVRQRWLQYSFGFRPHEVDVSNQRVLNILNIKRELQEAKALAKRNLRTGRETGANEILAHTEVYMNDLDKIINGYPEDMVVRARKVLKTVDENRQNQLKE